MFTSLLCTHIISFTRIGPIIGRSSPCFFTLHCPILLATGFLKSLNVAGVWSSSWNILRDKEKKGVLDISVITLGESLPKFHVKREGKSCFSLSLSFFTPPPHSPYPPTFLSSLRGWGVGGAQLCKDGRAHQMVKR